MGVTSSKTRLESQKGGTASSRKKVVVLGMEGAGKTTLVQKIKYGAPQVVKPTVGFNLENIKSEHLEFMVFDIAGGARSMWSHYLEGSDAILYVFDSTRKDNVELQRELMKMMNREIKKKQFLFVAILSKCDLDNSMTNKEFLDTFKIYDFIDSDLILLRTSSLEGGSTSEVMVKLSSYFSSPGQLKTR